MSDTKNGPTSDDVRAAVRSEYARIALADDSSTEGGSADACCGPACCTPGTDIIPVASMRLGYSAEDTAAVPGGADLGLGCGNPQAIAALQPGEVVIDLGSGGGFDCFLAANQVGPQGLVIGVDMTPDMVSKARANATAGGYTNVEFRLGEIEHLPVADSQADVVMSNCVINLSPEKPAVFAEAFRVLLPGGRLAVSDVVARAPIPAELREDLALHSACVSGAATVRELTDMLTGAGFVQVAIDTLAASAEFIADWAPGRNVEDYVVSATIQAVKPAHTPSDADPAELP